jgi:hypothetical protein
MTDDQHSNAMTEVALALAMAFFSIMVLAVVSMGVGPDVSATAEAAATTITMVPSAEQTSRTAGLPQGTIVIHFAGQFFDTDLVAIDPAALDQTQAIILAIDPSLTAAEAVALRDRVPAADVVITTLNQTWMKSLEEKFR